jgi:hypothetical protein
VESLEQTVVVSQDLLRVCGNPTKRPQISPLRCAPPGFPEELGGVGALHAAFFNESSTRSNVQRSVAGNPGPVEMTILFEGGAPCFQEKYEILVATELSSRPEELWACGPPKVMKNASVRYPLSMEPLPFPCHPDRSEAERRDLRFRGPFVEMFFDRAQRSGETCGFFVRFASPARSPNLSPVPQT